MTASAVDSAAACRVAAAQMYAFIAAAEIVPFGIVNARHDGCLLELLLLLSLPFDVHSETKIYAAIYVGINPKTRVMALDTHLVG